MIESKLQRQNSVIVPLFNSQIEFSIFFWNGKAKISG